ncbi:MAG: DUF1425 domain-containing protein [Geobacter sp.]|nr:DUF1425 domain-containing protein [Geobacter sp.]
MTRLVALLFGLLLISGCAATSGIEATGKTTWNEEGARELSKRVVINNGSLARDIEVADVTSSQVGDLMRAQVMLRSRDSGTLQFQYKFDWYDIQGVEVVDNAPWQPVILYGKEAKTIHGLGPNPRAREFKLKLKGTDE